MTRVYPVYSVDKCDSESIRKMRYDKRYDENFRTIHLDEYRAVRPLVSLTLLKKQRTDCKTKMHALIQTPGMNMGRALSPTR